MSNGFDPSDPDLGYCASFSNKNDGEKMISDDSSSEQSASVQPENVKNSEEASDNVFHNNNCIREGDSIVDLPSESNDYRPATTEEIADANDPDIIEREREFRDELRSLSETGSLPFLSPINHFITKAWKYISWCLYLFVAILTLYSITQYAHLYSSIASLPVWQQWVCFTIAILCLLFILWMCFIIVKKTLSFSKKPNLKIRALEIMAQRQEWRDLANKEFDKGKKQLEEYLKSFDLEKPDEDFRNLLTDDEFNKLTQGKKRLLSENNWSLPQEWIQDFQGSDFQGILDVVASRIVKHYAFVIASGTAISPKSFVDQAIVVMGSVAMTKDLLTLYRIQPAFGESLYLIAQGFFIAYIGGKMQWAAGTVTDIVSDSEVMTKLSSLAPLNLVNGVPGIGSMVKPVASKCTEGVLNYLLIQRLGKSIIKQLQPTEPQK